MSQCWSSKGNQVMSILQVLLKMPGGTYRQLPLCVTTTFVWYVPSKPSSALTCSYHIINHHHRSRSRFRAYLIISIVSRDFISSIFYRFTRIFRSILIFAFYFIYSFIIYWQEQDDWFRIIKWLKFLLCFVNENIKHLGNWFCYVDVC